MGPKAVSICVVVFWACVAPVAGRTAANGGEAAVRREGLVSFWDFDGSPKDEAGAAGDLREMKRYGVIPQSFDPSSDPIDVYKIDQAYWESLWHRPGR